MSDNSASHSPTISPSAGGVLNGSLKDYVQLLKPRVMSLSVFTALAAMIAAPGAIDVVSGALALLLIAIGAGGAGALNMWYDADIDRIMSRTAMRPIPRNRVTADEALALGLLLSIGSVTLLAIVANWVAAGLLALTIFYYVVIYSMWLKRSTSQNIVIGGAAGAFPPMIGWAAATGAVSLDSVLLFAIIFFWTPAHFWALALNRSRDYERAGIPMLPVVAGKDATRTQIFIYGVLTALIGLSPAVTGLGGLLYLMISASGGALFAWLSFSVYRQRQSRAMDKAARTLFAYSIFYLFALFATLLAEHALGLVI